MEAAVIGSIIGSIISGAIIGAIPGITGAVKGKLGLGIGGFFACLVGSILLGVFLSVPACIIFMYLICKKPVDDANINTNPDEQFGGVNCPKCGARIENGSKFCTKCGNTIENKENVMM